MTKDTEIITFGCRLNIYESEIIKENLNKTNIDNVAIFNTCMVTKEAEKEAIKSIRRLKKNQPDKKIIVTGCAAQTNPGIFASMGEVDKIIGNEEKLASENYTLNGEKVVVSDIMTVKETANHLVSGFASRARAFIQVQNGCDHRCTFCTIPYGRGNSRSVPIGVIAKQMNLLIDKGYQEIVFTGVDVTAYGTDLPGTPSLAQMIRRILALVPKLTRLRLSSIDIAEIDNELFTLISNEPRIMPHFHISLQAGDNMILKRMKRRHNREQILEFCYKLREKLPYVAFGADIIAGFPTESDIMFENTRKLIAEAKLQYLHVFPYSERENTPASRMPQVDKAIRKERATILREEGEKQLQQFYQHNIGRQVKLLVEKNNIAHSENFIPVKLTRQFKSGQIVNAKLIDIDGKYMVAKVA